MSNRTLLILSSALVVLLVLVFLGQRAETPQRSIAGEPLLPDLATIVNDVERVEVVRGGGEPVATLERDRERWHVRERDGYPADLGRLREMLLALAEARIVERATANPDLHERLGVEDIERVDARGAAVSLHAPEREPITVIVGDSTDRGQRYLRPGGEAQSYLVDRDFELPDEARGWLDPVILDVPGARVAEVTITHPDGEMVHIHKESPEQANFEVRDVPEDRELQFPGVANVTGNALRSLRLEDVERADEAPAGDAGEGAPAVARFRTFEGVVIEAAGVRRNGTAWVTFSAAADATAPPAEDEAPNTDDAAPAADAEAEAEAINARVAGWRYRIASHQYDQMMRRMEDFLQPRND